MFGIVWKSKIHAKSFRVFLKKQKVSLSLSRETMRKLSKMRTKYEYDNQTYVCFIFCHFPLLVSNRLEIKKETQQADELKLEIEEIQSTNHCYKTQQRVSRLCIHISVQVWFPIRLYFCQLIRMQSI